MTENIAPTAPESLPKYIADGIPKQDIETLEDMQEYISEMIEHKHRPIDIEADIPDDAEVVEEAGGSQKGAIYTRKQKCGDDTCHCADGKDLHGPYRYRVWRAESGEVKQEYVEKV
jgi:hypothetical protein